MDGLAFIIALGVGVAVIFWYVLNEAQGADGAAGIFSLRRTVKADDQKNDEQITARYRPRVRLTPARRAGFSGPTGGKAYRSKPIEPPFWRDDEEHEKAD